MSIITNIRVILGSSSPFRQQVMREMGYEFEVVTPDIDEQSIRHDDPEVLTIALADAKCEAVKSMTSGDRLIIAADQVVIHEGQIREKPRSKEEARDFIREASTSPSYTVSSVCVLNTTNGKKAFGKDSVRIFIKPIPESIIDKLIAEGTVMKCASGIQVENPLMVPYVERIEGTLDSIMGLPKDLTKRLISEVL